MGFFKKLFSAIDDSIQKTVYYVSHPSEALALKEDLMTPRDISYDGFFKKVDPVLDILSPSHNIVQEATTGSATTQGQLPYFEKIAPVIISAFFPVAGSLASGVNGVSQGKTTQAVVGLVGYGVGSYTSALSEANAYAGVVNGSETGLISISNAQMLGKLVNAGAGAYALYDAADKLKATTGKVVNMVSQSQQTIPIYSSANAGTPYGMLSGDGIANPNGALNAQFIEANKNAEVNRALILLAVVGLYFWSRK